MGVGLGCESVCICICSCDKNRLGAEKNETSTARRKQTRSFLCNLFSLFCLFVCFVVLIEQKKKERREEEEEEKWVALKANERNFSINIARPNSFNWYLTTELSFFLLPGQSYSAGYGGVLLGHAHFVCFVLLSVQIEGRKHWLVKQ